MASDGPEGAYYAVTGGTKEIMASTWTEAVAALWQTPPPRVIVAGPGATNPPFRAVGGAGLRIAATGTVSPNRSEIYRCRADTVVLPGGQWGPASPTVAADSFPLDQSLVDAYVVSADPAYRTAGNPTPPTPAGHYWLAPDGNADERPDPQVARHRWRWQISDASRSSTGETFALDHATGGPREMRTAGRVTVNVREPAGASGAWRSFRLSGDAQLSTLPGGSAKLMAYGWMFQKASEPLLQSTRFLSVLN